MHTLDAILAERLFLNSFFVHGFHGKYGKERFLIGFP